MRLPSAFMFLNWSGVRVFALYNPPVGCGMGFCVWCGVALLLLLCLGLWLNNER